LPVSGDQVGLGSNKINKRFEDVLVSTIRRRIAAEARARALIDRQLTDAGWSVQDKRAMNLFAAQGVAVREVTLKPDHGRADYLLYVDQRVVGVMEATREGKQANKLGLDVYPWPIW
jgi:type I site-specific restriction endonuclease